ncbi:MAG: carbohydrate-binding domain-containing protein [Clostridia bacterium]|nr:carbohydrate-binding domain-containing protein [Clostridia bacterium]
MKRKFRLAALLLSALLLSGCSLAEPTVPGQVKLTPRATSEALPNSTDDFIRTPVEISSDPIDIDISTGVEVAENGVRPTENGAEIYLPGTYRITGVSTDFVLSVDLLDDEAPVILLFDGAHLSSEYTAPLYIPRCSNCYIFLTEGIANTISGGTVPNDKDVNAAVWSMGNLTVSNGSLTVSGDTDNAVASKDILSLYDTELTFFAPDDGLSGRDALIADNCILNAEVGGDGIKATNIESGKVLLRNTTLNFTTGLDGVDGASCLALYNCTVNILSGGGHTMSEMKVDDGPRIYDPLRPSKKGVKSLKQIIIENSTLICDSADDCVHSDGNLTAKNSTFDLLTSDDAIHANKILSLETSNVQILHCFEALEGSSVYLRDFNAFIRAYDDGVNASSAGAEFVFDGGNLTMVCAGDGIDSNGSIEIFDGNIAINGPTPDYNSVLDFKLDYGCFVYGGNYVSTGASGMALIPEATDSAIVLSVTFDKQIPALVPIAVTDSQGNLLVCFTPEKAWQNFQFSSPDLTRGETVTIHMGKELSSGEICVSDTLPDGAEAVSEIQIRSQIVKAQAVSPF